MRLAEGLWYANEHSELLYAVLEDGVTKQANGAYANGDILYAEISDAEGYLTVPADYVDGHALHPLLKYYKIPKEDMERIKQRVLF